MDPAAQADHTRVSRAAILLTNVLISLTKTDNPNAQILHNNRFYDTLTETLNDVEPADIEEFSRFVAAATVHLYQHGYCITAQADRLTTDVTRVADDLHNLAGPGTYGYSQTVEVARGKLHDLATALDTRTRTPINPFGPNDLLVYDELSTDQIAWRALLAVLAATGATVSIPVELMPPASWLIPMVSGWTLQAQIDTDEATGNRTLSAEPAQIPPLPRLGTNQ